MAVSVRGVNRIAVVTGLFCLILTLGWPQNAFSGQTYRVAPVKKGIELSLLSSQAWPPPASGPGEMFVKLSYLRGIFDALQYVELAPKAAGGILTSLQGKDLNQLAAAIDSYYLKNPARRELPPAVVLIRILPDMIDKPGSIKEIPAKK